MGVATSRPHTRPSSPSPPPLPPTLSTRAIGQRRRCARERAARAHNIELNLAPVPSASPIAQRTPRQRERIATLAVQHEPPPPSPPVRQPYVEPVNVVAFGRMNVRCGFCAVLFTSLTLTRSNESSAESRVAVSNSDCTVKFSDVNVWGAKGFGGPPKRVD